MAKERPAPGTRLRDPSGYRYTVRDPEFDNGWLEHGLFAATKGKAEPVLLRLDDVGSRLQVIALEGTREQ